MIPHSNKFSIIYNNQELWVYYYPMEWTPYYAVHFPNLTVINISKSPTTNKWLGDSRAGELGELIDAIV